MDNKRTVAVIGAGAWGSALAFLLANNRHTVFLWDKDSATIKRLQDKKANQLLTEEKPPFPESLYPTPSFIDSISTAELIVIAVPSYAFKDILLQLKRSLPKVPPIVWVCKGFEPQENELLHETAFKLLGNETFLAVLSGPSFASEVMHELPTAVAVAANHHEFAEQLVTLFSNHFFRVYIAQDMVGMELGGAIKNVLAIATGISDGMGFGSNAKCALITRGLAEMVRLGISLGGKQETFMGLAGLGDLVLTCTDNQSRNRRFGIAIGQGLTPDEAMKKIGQVVEGYYATKQVYLLSQNLHIDMPITEQIYRILYQGTPAKEVVDYLLTRPATPE